MYAMFDEECKYFREGLIFEECCFFDFDNQAFKQVDIGMMNSNNPQTTTLVVNPPLLHSKHRQTSLTCLVPEWIRQEKCDD